MKVGQPIEAHKQLDALKLFIFLVNIKCFTDLQQLPDAMMETMQNVVTESAFRKSLELPALVTITQILRSSIL